MESDEHQVYLISHIKGYGIKRVRKGSSDSDVLCLGFGQPVLLPDILSRGCLRRSAHLVHLRYLAGLPTNELTDDAIPRAKSVLGYLEVTLLIRSGCPRVVR